MKSSFLKLSCDPICLLFQKCMNSSDLWDFSIQVFVFLTSCSTGSKLKAKDLYIGFDSAKSSSCVCSVTGAFQYPFSCYKPFLWLQVILPLALIPDFVLSSYTPFPLKILLYILQQNFHCVYFIGDTWMAWSLLYYGSLIKHNK